MNNEAEIIQSTELTNQEFIYHQDKAQIDTQISTAKAYPRNIKRATENSIAIATLDQDTASSCCYSLPRGGKIISGPSIHFALILAQNWGNLRIDSKITDIGTKSITSQSVCFDLENNLAIKTEVMKSIMGKNGRMNDDMITMTGNAANSVSLRNSILKVVPKAVVNKVFNEVKKAITGDISDETKLIKKRKLVFDGFKNSYGVEESEILKTIGKASIDDITQDDLIVIIGFGQAIKDGDSTADLIFRNKDNKPEVKNSKAISEEKERYRIIEGINNSKSKEELSQFKNLIPEEDLDLYTIYSDKERELKK